MPVCDLEIIARLRNSVDRTLILILLDVIVDERLGGGCRNRSRVERRKRCGRGITVFFLPLCFRKRRRASETRTRFCGLNLTEGERYTYVQEKYWMESGSVRGMLTTRSNGQMRRYWQLSSLDVVRLLAASRVLRDGFCDTGHTPSWTDGGDSSSVHPLPSIPLVLSEIASSPSLPRRKLFLSLLTRQQLCSRTRGTGGLLAKIRRLTPDSELAQA